MGNDRKLGDLSANESIYESIRQIAFHKLISPRTNAMKNTQKVSGYVVKVHTDSDDELCGTVDVQEYLSDLDDQQAKDEGMAVGLHEGVYLSAIQDNKNGLVVIPYLYSDVVIATDPETLVEYVIQYSHADLVRIDAHGSVTIGVTETEEFEMTEDSPDVDELEKTGVHAHTTYTPTSVFTQVAKSENEEDGTTLEITADKIEAKRDKAVSVMDSEKIESMFGDKASLMLDSDQAYLSYDKAQLLADANQLLSKYGAKEIVIKSDGVYVGSGSATEPAVLGNQLASLLVEWLTALSSMVTSTMMGPQPPVNVAKFVALQAKVNSYMASMSGFLSKNVKVSE